MDTPQNYVSYIIHNATNRGVEAKEIELRNPPLDMNSFNLTHLQTDSSGDSAGHSAEGTIENQRDKQLDSIAASNVTDSFLQVVVQKHHTRDQGVNANNYKPASAPTSRLPTASSPIKAPQHFVEYGEHSNNGMYVFPHPMLYYPNYPNPWQQANAKGLTDAAVSARSSSTFKKFVRAVRSEKAPPMDKITEEGEVSGSKWNCFGNDDRDLNGNDISPQRMEVYYFERPCGDYLSTTDCSPMPTSEKFVIRSGRVVERILAEVCAVPHLFTTMPIELAVQTQRLFLITIRNIIMKTTQTYSDYFLKPLLTVVFNALIQPPLIFTGNIVSSIRNTLQPLFGIVEDVLTPISKVLSSVHLIRVERRCGKCVEHDV